MLDIRYRIDRMKGMHALKEAGLAEAQASGSMSYSKPKTRKG